MDLSFYMELLTLWLQEMRTSILISLSFDITKCYAHQMFGQDNTIMLFKCQYGHVEFYDPKLKRHHCSSFLKMVSYNSDLPMKYSRNKGSDSAYTWNGKAFRYYRWAIKLV
jgi:hypothetical protein